MGGHRQLRHAFFQPANLDVEPAEDRTLRAQRRFAPGSRWRDRSHMGFRSPLDFDKVVDLTYERHGVGRLAERYWRYAVAYAGELVTGIGT